MQAQTFGTLRDLNDLGPAAALAPIAALRRLKTLRFASAHFATYLRRRYALPLKPWIEELDLAGLEGGATVVQAGTPSLVQDVVIRFPTGGTVGVVGVTYELSLDAGATFGAATALPLSGALLIDGVTTTLSGTIAEDDALSYSTGVDEALRGHVCAYAAWKLLFNRGLDPSLEQELKTQRDEAIKWTEDVKTGLALLDPRHDATPDLSEEGPLGGGQLSAYEFLDEDP